MKKIVPVIHNKIWGYEIWLVSSLKGYETKFEDNSLVKNAPLIKIIHAKEPLSVQVHPDDTLAKEIENQENGKSETWYVLDCEKNSELVLGLRRYDTNELVKKLSENNLSNMLNIIQAQKNKFYNISAGLVHGLGTPNHANIKVLEVQQPSDITYRLFDYKRLDKNNKYREIHVEKSLKCIKEIEYISELISKNHLYFENQYYSCEVVKKSKKVEKHGWAIVFKHNEYFAFELSKDEITPEQTIFYVSWK
ncbi:type I phosphomannose isomerase catalytic subunit [Mycoplasma anserisalpingitidis]|uniref:type I phosphomannose isomerase catalytic subunit n=1 Tax=Mycoplasma anserisalpingitidis TaxID=519450 RepID=UPI001CF6E961|nr:type I phosphomannose isomerase catalytic subunit [Mycoplasma anserisalpingitidis]UCU26897.1 class I mannose-6-phosphate isomerase [Mycoplasma anserisalpingitidis]UCU27736.1 class I mannose-6-phosphate isomerase [Mycoplasma anserisalpingitidis]